MEHWAVIHIVTLTRVNRTIRLYLDELDSIAFLKTGVKHIKVNLSRIHFGAASESTAINSDIKKADEGLISAIDGWKLIISS